MVKFEEAVRKVKKLIQESGKTGIDVTSIQNTLNIPKRRVYDVKQCLLGLDLIKVKGKKLIWIEDRLRENLGQIKNRNIILKTSGHFDLCYKVDSELIIRSTKDDITIEVSTNTEIRSLIKNLKELDADHIDNEAKQVNDLP